MRSDYNENNKEDFTIMEKEEEENRMKRIYIYNVLSLTKSIQPILFSGYNIGKIIMLIKVFSWF